MTPAQLDHLRRIDAHLEHLLDIAAKRTPGEWKMDGSVSFNHIVTQKESEKPLNQRRAIVTEYKMYPPEQAKSDVEYIASCAGNAEAGWRATRAAIALLLSMGEHRHDIETAKAGFDALESILAAFPNI